ncbi:endonuclease/exonuclease/phosphatase family protein [Myxococcus sp. AS-1-15]|uniref:endonuclease/exonuclease/phosphatase family protein n=1 Tax=Myxococcus sp. AS-1-15 TaxID=2874600 RepID=UPI001CBD5850|nr:endonuclease/exonuclease/phosphatase family protein [Myxococcus sp. AS-1-15]MBZ4395410.1 endonuclease/exonuclease/phosphatase family protein [Myxococcus sp. AS-1-15]
MKKTLSYLACAVVSLTVFALACGDSSDPKTPLPLPDGGVMWAECNPQQDGGGCGAGEECRFVPFYDRSICVRPCDEQGACGQAEAACCPTGEARDGGDATFCLPTEVCEATPDAGAGDAGEDADGGSLTDDGGTLEDAGPGTETDAGTTDAGGPVIVDDAGTTTDAGGPVIVDDAGTTTDAGTTDAGGPVIVDDAGTTIDAGSPVDAGPGTTDDAGTTIDAGSPIDAGTDAGSPIDAGTDAGSPVDAGTPDAGSSTDGGPAPGGYTNIRIMAANLSSGNGQDYDPGHGIRLMQGVDPDVVLIQEFNYKSDSVADITSLVNQVGPGFHYYREGGAQIPNGVISRWPIIESGEWKDPEVDNRDFAWARIDIPGPKDLWAVSVHLLTRSAGARNAEAAEIVAKVREKVPESDYLVIGGDLNTDSFSESCFTTFKNVVVTSAPYPADKNGKTGTNASRAKPYDHVLVDQDLNQYRTPTVIGSNSFPNGLVLDSRVYTPLSDIAPVQSNDSGAPSMQHMGVIKDFRVPAP